MPSIPSPRGRNTGGLGGLVCLVDVNNFYASCERVFDPGLEGRPVVVLSNNDGCIIARSQEAKDVGIPLAIMTSVGARCTRRFQLRPIALESAWFPTLEEVESS